MGSEERYAEAAARFAPHAERAALLREESVAAAEAWCPRARAAWVVKATRKCEKAEAATRNPACSTGQFQIILSTTRLRIAPGPADR